MPKGKKSQLVTKKHLARQQRERLQNRYILIVSVAVIVIVIGLIGYGIVQQYVIQPQQPVAKVGDQVVTTRQFQTYARYERVQWIQQYQYYQQLESLFGSDQSTLSYIQQLQSQITYQLQSSVLGQNSVDYLVANLIIQKEAAARGITVTDAELNAELETYMGFYPNGTPTPTATNIPVPTSTLNPTQIDLLPPTSTPLPTTTATATPTATITITQETATPTPAATAVITPTTPTATSTASPTPTPYTTQEYATNLGDYYNTMSSIAGLSESDLRWIITSQLLRQKVFDAITADVSRQQDQVWARHILVTDQTQAQTIYDELQQNPGDFVTIATQVYSGTTNTIDLGWFGMGTLEPNAEATVWAMKIGEISQPIQTSSGWEIYQVLGHDVRTLSDADFEALKQTDFQNWIDERKTADNAQVYDVWQSRVPTSPTIPPTQVP
jgi:parvulin-like peptidyl-prolyl isomerase